MSKSFDWQAMRRRALCDLGLRPAEFWALTPIEFLEMLGLSEQPTAMGRAVFERLCRDFPDGTPKERVDDGDT